MPISIIAAIFAQAVGHAGSCTQGSSDSWLAGATASLPFFLIIVMLGLATLLHGSAKRPKLERLAYAIVMLGAVGLLLANLGMLKTVVVEGSSICGAEFGSAAREDLTIAVVYGLVPLLAAIISFLAYRRIALVEPPPAS